MCECNKQYNNMCLCKCKKSEKKKIRVSTIRYVWIQLEGRDGAIICGYVSEKKG